jgi:hypothetical protein
VVRALAAVVTVERQQLIIEQAERPTESGQTL